MFILIINPGSTSTKIAVYNDEDVFFSCTLRHSEGEIAKFKDVISQFEFRKNAILDSLEKNSISLTDISVVIGRGGLIKPVSSGVYRVNEALLADSRKGVMGEHASNLGAVLADDLAKVISLKSGKEVPALIADPVVVDEMDPVARFSGSALIPRVSIFHALNQKAIARRFANEHGKKYEDLNLVIAHLGGGVSVSLHKRGRVADTCNALLGEGPFSPERSGGLPLAPVIDMCFSGKYTKEEMHKIVNGKGGMVSYLGTNSFMEVSKAAAKGDKKASDVIEAFVYQLAKEIGALSAAVDGNVDAVIITGGIANNESLMKMIRHKVLSIAPFYVYPGEDEMGALASNAYAAVNGITEIKEY